MKKLHTLLFFSLVFSVCFFSCETGDTTQAETEKNPQLLYKKTPKNWKVPSDSEYQITEECAKTWIENYEMDYKFPKVKNNKNQEVNLKGFHIKHGEFQDILKKNPNVQNVWAMMGVRAIEKGSAQPETIFVVESSSAKGDGPTTTYYNFTMPCPKTCPQGGN